MNDFTTVLSSSSLAGNTVVDHKGDKVGKIDDLMIDIDRGKVAYAVMSVGGFLGMGDKLFAVPYNAIQIDKANKRCILPNATKERFENAEGFDKDHWPQVANPEFGTRVHKAWGTSPYWL